MRLPRTLLAVAACAILIAMMTACGGSSYGGKNVFQPPPPPPPTGANYTQCSGQQVPNWQSNLFQTNYHAAIAAFVGKYGSDSRIGYIRIGLGRGGEINLPQGWNDAGANDACYGGYSKTWGYTVGGTTAGSSSWNTYLGGMVNFEGGLASSNPLLVSITPITGETPSTDTDDFVGPLAVQNGMSYGNQGLEASDITNYPSCGGDWCNLFKNNPPQIAELQTLGPSCPTGSACQNNLSSNTGPLDPLLPFATLHGGNDLELYYQDWLIAFDSDYANSIGVSPQEQSAYNSAIQIAAVFPGVRMQVLFPPQPGDSNMCGSLTCYAAVQTYLMSNSDVTGAVIDVDWSDFDIGNSSNNAHASYDFSSSSITEQSIAAWVQAGKKVNLVLQNTTYGGNGCPGSGPGSNGNVGSNCAMPAWMWTVLK